METNWRERLKKAKIVYWFITGGLVFFAGVVALGMAEIISAQQILTIGQWYVFLLIAGLVLQMISRRL